MVAWINYRQGWRTLFWAGLLVGTAALLDFLPLVNVLGYDFAFILGLLVGLAAVDIGHGVVSAARRQARVGSPARLIGEVVVTSLTLLVLPLLLSLANASRVRNCNLGAGLAFFILLPASTAVFASAAGTAVAIAVPGRRLGRIAVLALPCLSVAWALLRLYRDPAVFAFDPFAGYFPGPIYDEALRPPLRLVWYRLANLTWLCAIVAVVTSLCRDAPPGLRLSLRPWRGWVQPWPRAVLALALVVASLVWFEARGSLGIHVTHADLANLLPRVTRTEHFVLRTDGAVESDADIALAAEDLEFRYQQLARILGVEPSGPVRVYRFPSAAAKKDAVGAANTLYAKPWTREIFVQADRFPAQRLRHELAHVFASAFGDRWFGVSLAWHFPWPTLASGLVEGLAEAADFDNPSGRSTLHEETAAMIALGQAPELGRALGSGFTFESGPRAYTMVGSFCRYLLDHFGADKLRALYRSAGDFAGVYGRDLPALEQDWRAYLAALPSDERTRAEAEEEFRRPAIFRKVCARELAARVSEARARLSTAPAEAVALLENTCADDPDEPTFRLELAEAQIAAGEPERSLATLRTLQAKITLTRPLRSRAANLEAGIHFRAGRLAETHAALAQALASASEDADLRFARARQLAIAEDHAAATLARVFFGDERGRALDPALAVYLLTDYAKRIPGDAFGPYLVGRQLATRDPKLAVVLLDEACPTIRSAMARPLETVFYKECRRLLGETAYIAGDLSTPSMTFFDLARYATREAERLHAEDFLERIRWKAKTMMPPPSDESDGTTTPHDRSQVPARQ